MFWISFSNFVCHSWCVPMMKITGLSHLFKWENLHNWWLTKYFFAPLYIQKPLHPFNLVDLAISATPVADRCIKLSTQPCYLHRQRLAVQWPYWRAQWLSKWHRHRMPPFQQVSSSNFDPASNPAASVNCYCEVEIFRSNIGSAATW